MPRRGLSLGVLIVNQLLAGVGVASGIAVAALLAEELTGSVALAGLAQTSSVLGAGIVAIPLARVAVARGRHIALGLGYACALVGAVLILAATVSGIVPLVFVGLAAFGAGSAAGLQARFAATEVAARGFEARAMSLVLWATTLGSVAGPNLSEFGDQVGRSFGLPPLVGPFLFSGAAFALSTLLVAALLRLPRAGHLEADEATLEVSEPTAADAAGTIAVPLGDPAAEFVTVAAPPEKRIGAWEALMRAVRVPRALFAMLAIVCSHTVMVGVMVMTPVELHAHGHGLGVVGLVISVHILGMYGASPVFGWLVDRVGAVRVIVVGVVLLVTATVLGALAPAEGGAVVITLALGLLGLGWSAGLIGGSTLLMTAVEPGVRVPLQGATDAAMNLAAAASAAFSGVVLGLVGYSGVNIVALLVLLPLVWAAVRARSSRAPSA